MFTVKIYTLDEKGNSSGFIVKSCGEYIKVGDVLSFGQGAIEVVGTKASYYFNNEKGEKQVWIGDFRDIFIENMAGKTIDRIKGLRGSALKVKEFIAQPNGRRLAKEIVDIAKAHPDSEEAGLVKSCDYDINDLLNKD